MAKVSTSESAQTAPVVKATITEIELPNDPEYKDGKNDLKGRAPYSDQLGDPDGSDLMKG